MGKFTLFRSSENNEYYFNLKASNGEIILQSEGYVTKGGAENGIASVKSHSPFDRYYEKLVANDGRYYFNLKASNDKIIGVSQMYTTVSARENGINSVKSNAPDAPIEDLS